MMSLLSMIYSTCMLVHHSLMLVVSAFGTRIRIDWHCDCLGSVEVEIHADFARNAWHTDHGTVIREPLMRECKLPSTHSKRGWLGIATVNGHLGTCPSTSKPRRSSCNDDARNVRTRLGKTLASSRATASAVGTHLARRKPSWHEWCLISSTSNASQTADSSSPQKRVHKRVATDKTWEDVGIAFL